VSPGDEIGYKFTGKELDEETGLYYYGARYLDPKTSRWLSADPAVGEYIPSAPVNEEARRRNGNLPGMGGVYNLVNLHVYHYAGNNPIKYTDPDGRLLRDENGKLLFLSSYVDRGYYSDDISAIVEFGFLFTDKGTFVRATKNRDASQPGFDTNCHGVTFADGRYWIGNEQIDTILNEDNYEIVETPEIGDVVIYRESGNIVHSARVVNIKRQFSIFGFQFGKVVDVEVEGLGGLETEIHRDSVREAWSSADSITYYRQEE
jgi:RHS repeat-associated protein